MAVKLADTLAPMGDFEIAQAKDVSVEIGGTTKMLQTAIDNGEIGGGSSTFVGTQAEWEALLPTEKEKYEFVDFTDDVDTEVTKKFILIGDSYCQGYAPEGMVTSWAELFKSKMGLSDEKCKIFPWGGRGISSALTADYNFLENLKRENIANPEEYTDLILCAGRNDANGDDIVYGVTQGMKDFCDYVKATFPNAKIYIGFIGWDTSITEFSPNRNILLNTAYERYLSSTKENNAIYLNGVEYILHNRNYMASDGKHPNAEGQKKLADGIYQAYNCGSTSCYYGWTLFSPIMATGYVMDSNTFSPANWMHDNVTVLNLFKKRTAITLSTAQNMTLNPEVGVRIIENLNSQYITGEPYGLHTFNGRCIIYNGGYYEANYFASINSHEGVTNVDFYFCKLNDEHNNWVTLNGVTSIYFEPIAPITFTTMS